MRRCGKRIRVPTSPACADVGSGENRMHDWLVCIGGVALMNYMQAKQRGEAQGLATMKQFADYSMRLALGIEGKNLSLSGPRIVVAAPAAATTAGAVDRKILGAWTTSSALNDGHFR